jgi:hypothetical protein
MIAPFEGLAGIPRSTGLVRGRSATPIFGFFAGGGISPGLVAYYYPNSRTRRGGKKEKKKKKKKKISPLTIHIESIRPGSRV